MEERRTGKATSQRNVKESSIEASDDLKLQLHVTLPIVPMAIGRREEVTPAFWNPRHQQHHHHHHHYHHHHHAEEENEPPPPPQPPPPTACGPKLSGGFQQMVRMMDSLILHNLPSLGYTRIRAAKTTTTTAATEVRETKGGLNKDNLNTVHRHQNANIGRSDIDQVKDNANVKQRGRHGGNSPKIYPVNNKWIESLRRNKPDIQSGAALPVIDRRTSNYSVQSASIANGRKARSVERLTTAVNGNATREGRDRKTRVTHNPATLRSSVTTTTTTLTLTSVRPFGATRRASLATSTIIGQPTVSATETPPATTFHPVGYEPHLVHTIVKDMLHKNVDVRWEHIAGLDEAKNILQEAMVLPIVMPDYFTGIRRPWRGVLMVGPPGNGKTMLAKAVASECGTTFFNVSPSTLTSKYRGDSEKLVRLLFEMARFHSPSTVFIDEVDSLCSLRGNDNEHEASRRFKSELLIQMDGLNTNSGDNKIIMVLAATNHPWDIDEGFRRRFEKRIYIGMPDDGTRAKLVSLCLRGVAVDEKIDTNVIADKLQGYSAADMANVCRDAAMMSMRRAICGRSAAEIRRIKREDVELPVTMRDFDEAIARCRKSVPQSDIDKYKDWMEMYGST